VKQVEPNNDLSSNFFRKYNFLFSNPQALLHCF
jgi:hypothetical protein